MTERERFMTRLSEARDSGLVDMKFFFRPSQPMKPEEIFGSLNEVDAAIKNGKRHEGWRGNEAAPSQLAVAP